MKTIRASEVISANASAGKWQFLHVEATNQQSGHGTVLHFDRYQPNQQIPDDVFTPRYLERDQ